MTPTENTALDRLRARIHVREARAAVLADARTARATRRATQRLAAMRRDALLAGERARTAHEVHQSGEMRALRVERTRTAALLVLLPIFGAFAAWSTTGVHAGVVMLLNLPTESAGWWGAWLIEPALLTLVAGVIILRTRLRSSGGDLDERAARIEWGALSLSIVLNAAGSIPEEWTWAALGALLAHAIGPVGAAATAYLISIVSDAVADADPWHTADGDPVPTLKSTPESASEDASESASGTALERAPQAWPGAAPESARLLPIVARPTPQPPAPRTPRSTRKRASESAPERRTDDDIVQQFAALVAAGELTPDSPMRQVQAALGVGFERGKRVVALYLARPLPGQLTVVDVVEEAV